MQRERIPEIAVRQGDEVEPVLLGDRLVEPELRAEPVALDLVYVLASAEVRTRPSRREMNQNEDERDDSEDDRDGRDEAPQEPRRCHLWLHAGSIHQPG